MSQRRASARGWSIFDDLLHQGVLEGNPIMMTQDKMKVEASLTWFKDYIKNNVRYANVWKNNNRQLRNQIIPGHMYTYKYFAKTADKLPYWDAQPLIFPFRDEGETFLGINLHYAPPKARVIIMRQIYQVLSNPYYDANTKANINYQKLQRMAAFGLFRPLIKRYRKDHVRSQFLKVDVKFWPIAVFLPIQKWQKQNANVVYRDFNKKTRFRAR